MRIIAVLLAGMLPLAVSAQEKSEKKSDPSRLRIEITGCVKGSTLTETNLRVSTAASGGPLQRWRLRGSKTVMDPIKKAAGKEMTVVGSMKDPGASAGGTRIGRTNIFIGGNPDRNARDPLPEQPTIDVQSFELTGETCPSR